LIGPRPFFFLQSSPPHPDERPKDRVSKGEASWFETAAFGGFLTMRGRGECEARAFPLPCTVSRQARKKTYPRSLDRIYLVRSLAHRGRRRSRRLMTERGAVSDNDIAVERLEAPGPSPRARASSPDAPADPSSRSALGTSRKGSQGAAASRVYPTCALDKPISGKPEIGRAPSSRKRGKENGKRADPGARATKNRAAERWLSACQLHFIV
jgi:hypothetical protein